MKRVKMQVVRMYGSKSYYGPQPRINACGSPIIVPDFPTPGDRALIYLGAIPDEIIHGESVAQAFIKVLGPKLFGAQGAVTGFPTAEITAFLEQNEPGNAEWRDYTLFTTAIVERDIGVNESQLLPDQYLWLDPSVGDKFEDEFKVQATEHLNLLTAMTSVFAPWPLLEKLLVDNRVYFSRPDRCTIRFPRVTLVSAELSVRWASAPGWCDELRAALHAFPNLTEDQRGEIMTAIRWHVASITEDDEWKRFLWGFLGLEILSKKLSKRLYESLPAEEREVIDKAFRGSNKPNAPRLSLRGAFATLSRSYFPESASEHELEFRHLNKVRNDLAHGDIDLRYKPPTQEASNLLRNYLSAALRAGLPLQES